MEAAILDKLRELEAEISSLRQTVSDLESWKEQAQKDLARQSDDIRRLNEASSGGGKKESKTAKKSGKTTKKLDKKTQRVLKQSVADLIQTCEPSEVCGLVEVKLDVAPDQVNSRDSEGQTPLHLAAGLNPPNPDLLALLLEHKANVNLQDSSGWTALHTACKVRSSDGAAVKLLVSKGADPKKSNDDGTLPLHYLVRQQPSSSQLPAYLEALELMLETGKNVNKPNRNGETALQSCALYGHKNSLKALLDHPSTDVDIVNNQGETVLHYAILRGNKQMVDMLLDHGMDPRVQSGEQSPLALAESTGVTGKDIYDLVRAVAASLDMKGMSKTEKSAYRKQMTIEEILTTEKYYHQDLDVLQSVFYIPLAKKVAGPDEVLPQGELDSIFVGIRDVLKVSKELYSDLTKDQDTTPLEELMVGEIFLCHLSKFEVYTDLLVGQQDILEALARARGNSHQSMSEKKKTTDSNNTAVKFEQFLARAKQNKLCRQLDIDSFLMKPFQRITKYPLLLRELIGYTSEDHPDFENLRKAQAHLNQLITRANDLKKKRESARKTQEVMDKIAWDGSPRIDLVAQGSRLLNDASWKVSSDGGKFSKRHLFLFNDILIVTMLPKRGQYLLECVLPLERYQAGELEFDYETGKKLTHSILLMPKNDGGGGGHAASSSSSSSDTIVDVRLVITFSDALTSLQWLGWIQATADRPSKTIVWGKQAPQEHHHQQRGGGGGGSVISSSGKGKGRRGKSKLVNGGGGDPPSSVHETAESALKRAGGRKGLATFSKAESKWLVNEMKAVADHRRASIAPGTSFGGGDKDKLHRSLGSEEASSALMGGGALPNHGSMSSIRRKPASPKGGGGGGGGQTPSSDTFGLQVFGRKRSGSKSHDGDHDEAEDEHHDGAGRLEGKDDDGDDGDDDEPTSCTKEGESVIKIQTQIDILNDVAGSSGELLSIPPGGDGKTKSGSGGGGGGRRRSFDGKKSSSEGDQHGDGGSSSSSGGKKSGGKKEKKPKKEKRGLFSRRKTTTSGGGGGGGSDGFVISAPTGPAVRKVHVDKNFNWEGDPEEQFEKTKHLGTGAYGSVYLGTHTGSNMTLAIKILSNVGKAADEVKKEIDILKLCKDPNIVQYYGCMAQDSLLWILMEFCGGGSVVDLLPKLPDGHMEERVVAAIMVECFKGLLYLHGKDIIHRDIKSGNILLTSDGKVKLADFGVSAVVQDDEKKKTTIGTPLWMAPEVLEGTAYGPECDIWSMGITAIEMAEGKPPHSGETLMKAILAIAHGDPATLSDSEAWSKGFHAFLALALKKDPKERPSASEVIKDSWLVDAALADPERTIKSMLRSIGMVEDGDEGDHDDHHDGGGDRASSSSFDGMTVDEFIMGLRKSVVDKKEDDFVHAVDRLVRAGVSNLPARLQEPDKSGKTLLYWACYLEQPDSVKSLLDAGVIPTYVELHAALAMRPRGDAKACTHITMMILSSFGEEKSQRRKLQTAVNSKANDWDGSAIHVALQCTHSDTDARTERVRLLLSAKADPSVTVQKGTSPLHLCAESNDVDAAKLILDAAGTASARKTLMVMVDNRGLNPKELAEKRGNKQVARYYAKMMDKVVGSK